MPDYLLSSDQHGDHTEADQIVSINVETIYTPGHIFK